LRPSYASCPADCCITSCHATASRQPASPPLIAPLVRLVVASPLVTPLPPPLIAQPPLITPLLRLLSGWLLRHLSSRPYLPSACASDSQHTAASYHAPLTIRDVRVSCLFSSWLLHRLSSCCRLPSACASASHCTAASHCAPLTPLVQLVAALPLVTLRPPIHLHLHLLSHCRLLLHPSYASCQAGCCVTFRHAATSRPPAPPPLIAPISRLLSGWLSHHLLSCHHRLPLPVLPPLIVPPPLIAPLLRLFSGWLLRHPRHAAASHLPALRLSLHRRLSPRPSRASCLDGCCVASCHAATSHQPAPLPHSALLPLIVPLLQLCVQCKAGNDQ
jgi:hypothetical protein